MNEEPKAMLLAGGKRAGKTFLCIPLFMRNVARFHGRGYRFILAGTTQSSIRRNILDDMENATGKKINLDKTNTFELFGNKITCFTGSDAGSYKDVRGFTSYGAFMNEATTLHETFIREVFDRCSGFDKQLQLGAQIIMDTNPENPNHYVKTDFFDRSGTRNDEGQLMIHADTFTLFDNDTLSKEYIDQQIATKPEGLWRDRDIYGKWVSAEGVVYRMFSNEKNYIPYEDIPWDDIVDAYAGVDWGYDHYGSIVVIVEDSEGNKYLVEEHAHQYEEIDFWVEKAIAISRKYPTVSIDDYTGEKVESYNIPFYCDSARPEHVIRFQNENLNAINANKSILSGIEKVATAINNRTFKVATKPKDVNGKGLTDKFDSEIYSYSWDKETDLPVSKDDDVLDAVRYAIYSHMTKPTWTHI